MGPLDSLRAFDESLMALALAASSTSLIFLASATLESFRDGLSALMGEGVLVLMGDNMTAKGEC